MVPNRAEYLGAYHDWNLPKPFRGETNGRWRPFASLTGSPVADLQHRLRSMSFYPRGEIDGVYGYRTQSSVRLFQEYVRAVEGRIEIGDVDGLAGDGTQEHIDRWMAEGLRPAWGSASSEYRQTLAGLKRLQERFKTSSLKGIRLLNENAAGSSSLSVDQWRYRDGDIHLVGVRRNENEVFADAQGRKRRRNDDLLVLLVNGMRFVFRGSTNPSPNMARRPDQAFLLRGQHRYRFGWHKLSTVAKAETKVYRAFKPQVPAGPLIVRAVGNLLTDDSFRQASANPAINIHWSGSGTSNWSAGCQVIAGLKYIDFRNELVDLTGRAAASYSQLSGAKTRGAYNVLVDLITVFAEDARTSGDTIYYTLLYERDVREAQAGAPIDFDEIVARLN